MSSPKEQVEITLAEDKRLQERVENAVNISATMYNCFFHAYALHLMANGLPFPDDLFTVHDTDNIEIKNLKTIITSPNDLSLFENYDRLVNNRIQEHLAEKVLVLGVLFRSWFIHLVKKDKETVRLLFNDRDKVGTPFYWVVDRYKDGEEWLKESIQGAGNLYSANKAFFDSPELAKVTLGSALAYWEKEGYDHYLKYLNQPNVKIFVHEIELILKLNNISYTIYNKQKGSVASENRLKGNHLELAIHEQYEHFYLIPNEATASFLKRYTLELKQSSEQREDLLQKNSHDKIGLAKTSPFLLLAAMLPPSLLPEESQNPVIHMVNRLKELKSAIALRQSAQATSLSQNTKSPLHEWSSQPTPTTFLSHPLTQANEPTKAPLSQASKKSQEQKSQANALSVKPVMTSQPVKKSPKLPTTDQEKNYAYALYFIQLKALEFKKLSQKGTIKKYQDAYKRIKKLHKNLNTSFENFLSSDKSHREYIKLAQDSRKFINKDRTFIEHHRGVVKQVVVNAVLGVMGLLFIYLGICSVKYCINQHFFFKPNTDTANKIAELEKELDLLETEIKTLKPSPEEREDTDEFLQTVNPVITFS